MTWFDELDEPTQQQWRSRIAKERIDLSASVEETLADPSGEQDMWLDEYAEVDGVNVVDAHVEKTPARTAIIPPRLSLQTKPIPVVSAVFPAVSDRANAALPSVVPSGSGDRSQVPDTSRSEQHTNVFARLAQRLTSSLAAITAPFQVPLSEPQPPEREASVPMPLTTPQRPDGGFQTVTTVRVERSETTTTTIIGPSPAPYSDPVGIPSRRAQIPRGKQRPAGYPTKVHLQAAPKSISSHSPVHTNAGGEATYAAHENTEPLTLRKSLPSPRSAPTTVELPTALTPQSLNDAAGVQLPEKPSMTNKAISEMTTSGCLSTVHASEKKMEEKGQSGQTGATGQIEQIVTAAYTEPTARTSQPGTALGSGVFEAGQADVAITNQHITSASVVNVMLSSDPGPVVVQYVSLQPGTGFTIHLSAPTKMKTTFNYAVFQGEL